jgi:uncharacterized protein with ParB-like and HNH nuclease domain
MEECKMEAKQNSITKFMQQPDAQFFIPVYQRNYEKFLNEFNLSY